MPADRPRPSAGPQLLILLAALGGATVVLCGGGVAGLWFLAGRPADEAAQQQDAPPAPVPEPRPAPPPEPEPQRPEPLFRKAWAAPFDDGGRGGLLAVSDDGARVFAQDSQGIRVIDGRTGQSRGRLAGAGVPAGPAELWPVGRDKVLLAGPQQPYPSQWHVATGTQPGEIVPNRLLPNAPPDSPTSYAVSPDGRHLFVGAQGKRGAPGQGVALIRVFEVASAQPVAQAWWQGGNARFTADGLRVLVAEANGRCRWLRVAGGVQEAGWTYPAAGVAAPLVAMSGDGALLLYDGKPAGLDAGRYLIDGKNGQVLRAVGPEAELLTADGRRLVGMADGDVVVADARTGAERVREPVAGAAPRRWAFRADGTAFLLHDQAASELALYELPGLPASFPGFGQPPPALGPVPDPLPAVAFGPPLPPVPGMPPTAGPPFGPPPFVTPPVVTPMPTPTVKGPPVPPPPPLVERWTKAAEVNALPMDARFAPLFTPDGKTIALHSGSLGSVLVYDAADGSPLPPFPAQKASISLGWVAAFGDRFATPGADGQVGTWIARTGVKVDPLAFPDLPNVASTASGLARAVSPTGRYTAHARRLASNGQQPTPLRVLDTTTGKTVLDTTWNVSAAAGFIGFTADELRVVVLTGGGKASWYRLPSGELDAEWTAAPDATAKTAKAVSMTADGSRLLYIGQLAGGGTGAAVLDGKTAAVIRRIDNPPYQPQAGALSPDGRFLAVPVSEPRDGVQWHVDVLETTTWKKVGRVSPPREHGADVPLPRFSPDGKTLAVVFRAARQLALFDTPAGGPKP